MKPIRLYVVRVCADSPGNEYEMDAVTEDSFGAAEQWLRNRGIREGEFGEILAAVEDRARDQRGRYKRGGLECTVIESFGCLMPDGSDTFARP